MTPTVELCYGCMDARDPSGICPRCGYKNGTPPTSPLYLKPGTVLHEQYLVGRVLGHGGFGITYLGYDSVLQRKVAIKEYLPSSLASRHTESDHLSVHYEQLRVDFDFGLQRFLEEARTLARFHGFPNIIWVMNFFSTNGTAYMVMEYLEGETFEAYLERNKGRISFAAARTILMPVMDALREVHRQSYLHRDISPDNIFLVNGGPVKVLDFGAARYAMSMRSQGLSVIVKEGYAPEEQYTSKGEQGPWTDVYGLAGTMYRALTGHLPTHALERRLTGDLTLPSLLGSDIPPECEEVLMHALALDATERYQTVEEFQAALVSAAGSSGGVSRRLTGETQAIDLSKTMAMPVAPARSVKPVPAPTTSIPASSRRLSPPVVVGALLLILGAAYAFYRGAAHGKPDAAAPVEITSFSAKDATIAAGATTTLNWDVSHADHVRISPDPGDVSPTGAVIVNPRTTTTYRLIALSTDGKSVEKDVQVVVLAAGMSAAAKPNPFPVVDATTPPPSTPLVPGADPSHLPAVAPPVIPSVAASAPLADASQNRFLVSHIHNNGTAPGTGILEIRGGRVSYRSTAGDQPSDNFDEPVSSIAEARKNHRFLPGGQAFHIRFKTGPNFNFEAKNANAAAILKALVQ